jgi:hypothetical protein
MGASRQYRSLYQNDRIGRHLAILCDSGLRPACGGVRRSLVL